MKIAIAFIAGMAFMYLITYITAKLVLWDDSVDFYGDEEEEYHEERRGISRSDSKSGDYECWKDTEVHQGCHRKIE